MVAISGPAQLSVAVGGVAFTLHDPSKSGSVATSGVGAVLSGVAPMVALAVAEH